MNYDYLLKQLKAEKEKITFSLMQGKIKSYEDYRYCVGIIQGLQFASDTIKNLIQNKGYDDE